MGLSTRQKQLKRQGTQDEILHAPSQALIKIYDAYHQDVEMLNHLCGIPTLEAKQNLLRQEAVRQESIAATLILSGLNIDPFAWQDDYLSELSTRCNETYEGMSTVRRLKLLKQSQKQYEASWLRRKAMSIISNEHSLKSLLEQNPSFKFFAHKSWWQLKYPGRRPKVKKVEETDPQDAQTSAETAEKEDQYDSDETAEGETDDAYYALSSQARVGDTKNGLEDEDADAEGDSDDAYAYRPS